MNIKNNSDVIIEDVVYYIDNYKIQMKNTAKDTFYYQFLMDRADSSINGQNNYTAANDFYYYEEIFTYLLSLGILNSKEYCIDWTPIYGGATFSFNLSKAQRDLDIETMLYEKFADKQMSDYIKTFCHPADRWRCSVCGAVSLSRHLSFADDNGEKLTYCLACNPINDDI